MLISYSTKVTKQQSIDVSLCINTVSVAICHSCCLELFCTNHRCGFLLLSTSAKCSHELHSHCSQIGFCIACVQEHSESQHNTNCTSTFHIPPAYSFHSTPFSHFINGILLVCTYTLKSI